MLITTVRRAAAFLIAVTGGSQCEGEAFLHSLVHLFVYSPSLCVVQETPGIGLGVGGTETSDKILAPVECRFWCDQASDWSRSRALESDCQSLSLGWATWARCLPLVFLIHKTDGNSASLKVDGKIK